MLCCFDNETLAYQEFSDCHQISNVVLTTCVCVLLLSLCVVDAIRIACKHLYHTIMWCLSLMDTPTKISNNIVSENLSACSRLSMHLTCGSFIFPQFPCQIRTRWAKHWFKLIGFGSYCFLCQCFAFRFVPFIVVYCCYEFILLAVEKTIIFISIRCLVCGIHYDAMEFPHQ